MQKYFSCANKYFDEVGDRYINSSEQLKNMDDTYLYFRCYVDDFLLAVKEFQKVKNKEIYYFINFSENITVNNYENSFDVFVDLEKYNDRILGLELGLSKPVDPTDFNKLVKFIDSFNHNLDLRLNIGNLSVFNNEQLYTLKEVLKKFDVKLNINQAYDGAFVENNDRNNNYSFDELISLNSKVDEIIKKVPNNYSDIKKVLFVYKYLGKKIKYDHVMAKMSNKERKINDQKSLYRIFFEGKGVCSGIAPAFRILMNKLGIECKSILSIGHEWNVVKIDGLWYHLDLTWDLDNIHNEYDLCYFLKSENFILKDKDHQFYTYYSDSEEIAKRSIIKTKYQ